MPKNHIMHLFSKTTKYSFNLLSFIQFCQNFWVDSLKAVVPKLLYILYPFKIADGFGTAFQFYACHSTSVKL